MTATTTTEPDARVDSLVFAVIANYCVMRRSKKHAKWWRILNATRPIGGNRMLEPGRSKRRLDGWEIVLAIAAVLWLLTVATYAILR